MTQLDGILTALLTPCDANGDVDEDALAELVRFQAASGVTGLFVLGTAGLGPMLDETERLHLARRIVALAHPELRVVAHVGADAVAAVPPVYYQPGFRSVERHYERIARAADGLPLLAYNNPSSTSYDLRPEQATALNANGVIFGARASTRARSSSSRKPRRWWAPSRSSAPATTASRSRPARSRCSRRATSRRSRS